MADHSTPVPVPKRFVTDFGNVRYHVVHYGFTGLICTAIAVLVWASTGDDFLESFVFSMCIGLSVHTLTVSALTFLTNTTIWKIWAVTIPSGAILGLSLGALINGIPVVAIVDGGATVMSIIISLIATYVFYSYYTMIEMRETLRERQLSQLIAEKRLVETRLRLLQSQIEPHFLFNTLSHVISLIGEDAQRAELMLQKLTQFLRASLRRSRSENATLEDEIDLLSDYLAILKIRMGDRLQFSIDVAVDSASIRFPPLILQPLVENAIVHGLEPLESGGTISIDIRQLKADTHELPVLKLSVSDTGAGLGEGSGGEGIGINSVRQRLQALFGPGARLEMRDVEPSGLCVEIRIPMSSLGK